MVHQRIRPFNTRETYPEQSLDNDLAQAVVAGNIVFLREQVFSYLEQELPGSSTREPDSSSSRAMLLIACSVWAAGSPIPTFSAVSRS